MAAGGAAAASAAMMINNASTGGLIVRVESHDFLRLVHQQKEPLVVVAEMGIFSRHFHYLTTYKGLGFVTKSSERLALPATAEVVHAKSMWLPV